MKAIKINLLIKSLQQQLLFNPFDHHVLKINPFPLKQESANANLDLSPVATHAYLYALNSNHLILPQTTAYAILDIPASI